jgi:hypothetical protein
VPEVQSDDPILKQSYANAILVSSFLLVLTLAWALYQEMFGLRPWRFYQTRFVAAYSKYLEGQKPKQKAAEEAIVKSPEYKSLMERIEAAQKAAESRAQEIRSELAYVDRRNSALADTFMTERARIAALVYQTEISSSESSRKSRKADVDEARNTPLVLDLPTRDGKTERKTLTFPQLEAEFTGLKDRKATLTGEQARLSNGIRDLQQQAKAYFEDRMVGLTVSQLGSLQTAAKKLDPVIRQINVGSAGLVDRCQSCHVAMDPKVVPANLVLTKADLGMAKSGDAPFSSHPNPELLKIHDPDKFGCSGCHGGNGRATNSVENAHGRYEHWLWPLYYKENVEAGCQSCHAADMVIEQATVLNRGKELYRIKGCIGCHRYEGFDNEGEQLLSARQTIRTLEQQKKDLELNVPRVIAEADHAADNTTAQSLYQKANDMRVTTSNIDARIEQLDHRNASLMREEKKIGPSLKEARMKLRKEWIPYWIEHTHEFRPTTKMPQFRLTKDEVQALAAFVWQNALTGPVPAKQSPGNAEKGKQFVETRGCLACHAMGEGANAVGGTFAANLSRVGEKDNFDYLVRWVRNPRERTRPYDPIARVDLGPEDYSKFNKPFVFDLDHDRSPDGKHLLQVQLPTVMPNLRLTIEESRDIASYLITLRHAGASYPPAEFMDDAKLKDKGRALVKNYGCASCHELSGLEEEGRIGTELTTEGSKPIERLDFALLTEEAKRGEDPDGKKSPRGSWYDQKGFFEAKLKQTNVFDKGRLTAQLKMPQPGMELPDRTALVTFLLGSVDQQLPQEYIYKPGDARHDIQEGWWVVTKYNCMGCHNVRIGQQSVLSGLPQYQGDTKDKLPPQLIGEGARVDPAWLAKFLENPSLSTTDTNRNGVRSYLAVRMPTFSFSDGEVQKIVRFFAALGSQSMPYMPPKLEPLSDAERTMARDLFTHPAAPCLKCHATGVPAHDASASAPNFLLTRERLKPAWSYRWILDPSRIAPGTAMPSGLFRKEGDVWVFSGQLPASFKGYTKDQADLLIRYLFQLTPEEQRMLVGRSPAPGGKPAGQ